MYYLNMIPFIFLTVSPFSIPIAVFYTFGELNRFNEVLSMRASGISILRIAFPILFFAFIVSSVSLIVQEKLLLTSQKKIEDIKMRYIKKSLENTSEEINFAFTSGDKIFFAAKFSPREKSLYEVMIFEENEKNNVTTQTSARSIVYNGSQWVANNVMEYVIDNGQNLGAPSYWRQKIIPLDEKPETLAFKKSILSQFAPLKTLKKEMRQLKKVKAIDKFVNLQIDYNRKIAEPLSNFFLVIGILPVALEIKKRRAAFSSLGTGIIFSLIYYAFMFVGLALGKTGLILPNLCPWIAPLFFASVGISGLFFIK
jgi:lipopolysaccharide export system permease protein